MRSTPLAAVSGTIALALACTATKTSQAPSPQTPAQPSSQTETSSGALPSAQPGPRRPGGPGGQGRRPNPMQQDTLRRAQVDSIMRAIAGRENEPAGTVFKNVKLMRNMPARDFLRNMDENYGRGLGMTCGNCHVIGQYDQETRKNKRVARQMQEMTDYINGTRLAQMQELDEDYVKVSCVTCHAGSGHPRNTMPVPQPAAPNADF